MMETGTPKRLWDDCIDFMVYVRSNISNGHIDLKGQTQETIVSGEAEEISEVFRIQLVWLGYVQGYHCILSW